MIGICWSCFKLLLDLLPLRHRDEDAIKEKKTRESCFVLLTSISDDERFPDREILRLYKDQQLAEQHFSQR